MGNKKPTGTAKFFHELFTVCGGVKQYNDIVGLSYIERFIRDNSDSIQSDIQGKINRKKIKVS